MKFLSNTTLQASLLLVILGYYGLMLSSDVVALRQVAAKQRIMSTSSSSVVYTAPTGISVEGKLVVPVETSTRYLVFVLQGTTVEHDIDFWLRVQQLLLSHKEIALVGYCDKNVCAEAVSKMQPLPFPVLAYGEARDTQVVTEADAGGDAILKIIKGNKQSKMPWRSPQVTPQMIATEASQ